jgi:caa(3)-type oxidase subunit IV
MAGHKHIGGFAIVMSWIALVLLTALSWAASVVDAGRVDAVIAIGIASIKGVVVVFVFMHLLESRFATRMVALVSVLFIVILVLGIVGDVSQRRELPWPTGEEGFTGWQEAVPEAAPATGASTP